MKNQNSLRKRLVPILYIVLVLTLNSCKKGWLDAKPDKTLIIPTTIQDYQAILDNSDVFNANYPGLNDVSSDNYTVTLANWQSSNTALERNSYRWSSEIYEGETVNFDWTYSYKRILYANIVVEGIAKISTTNQNLKDWNNVKGSALFYRAFSYFNLTQLFCKPFNEQSANNDLGLLIRLSPDPNERVKRATIKETYSQILLDLNTALDLLPSTSTYLTRPSKQAVYALLARIYLSMGNFDSSLKNSNAALGISDLLIDYNTLKPTATLPFVRFSNEIIFHSEATTYKILSKNSFNVDVELYNTYEDNDLRKVLYFTLSGTDVKFKGNYSGSNNFFSGLAIDEMLLIRAECFARKDKTNEALADLNLLLKTRWKKNNDGTSTYVDRTASNATIALKIILDERRKELLFRELRWIDLRRLNTETNLAITLKRTLDGKVYSLAPNDKKYTLSIPPDEIRLSGIEQNSRD
ncbi:RagB/SusD family nutrient uptake outer membrane protein [Pedobacter gandavensis]|uniref:RagB/SusD family nutrient uptake outer membrane protein n=1 Tax=Pedobacter gandavensis TaxID=2679963 RepID=A0ABR6EUN7_9SPHI|nr:RagB/SusD family nutrient uptake outer membrane protein [Pedobacter gandavensis]MBB2148959.1 RagB/SusD family nutrient uptake outer membrane protein [Pedobacter gandavensis]